jgi:hypothetical protein
VNKVEKFTPEELNPSARKVQTEKSPTISCRALIQFGWGIYYHLREKRLIIKHQIFIKN